MNKDNQPPAPKVVESVKKPCPNCNAGWFNVIHCYDCGSHFSKTAVDSYNYATASLIQTIESRVKELEVHQSAFKPTSNTYQELGYCIIELRNLLVLIK